MCKYCKPHKNYYGAEITKFLMDKKLKISLDCGCKKKVQMSAYILPKRDDNQQIVRGDVLRITVSEPWEDDGFYNRNDIEINFCPMCGEKLR